MKNRSCTEATSPAGISVGSRLPRHGLGALLTCTALLLATPTLFAAPSGGKGKPGGGGEDPPPPPTDATFTYERVYRPGWAEAHRATGMNNNGVVIGEGLVKKRGGWTNIAGYVWVAGAHDPLPPLPGGDGTDPFDLSDDATIIVGESLNPDTFCAWLDPQGSGNYTAVDLEAILLEVASIHLPDWSFDSIESGVLNGADKESVLSSDGTFLRAMGRYQVADDAPVSDFGIVDLVVQLDWSLLLVDPAATPVVRMWAMHELLGSDPQDPFLHGARIQGYEIEIGVRSAFDSSPVVRMAGVRMSLVHDWVDYYEEPVVWEYDLAADATSVRVLATSPWFSAPLGINIYGAAVGADSLWDAAGNVSQLPITSDADPFNSVRGINAAGTVAGPARNYQDGLPFIWSAGDGLLDLNTEAGGSLGLSVARDINDAGQILAGGSGGYYVLTPIVP